MRMRPEGIAEADANIQWGIGRSLQLMEEVVCGPQDSGTGAPGMREGDGMHSPGPEAGG